MPVRLTRQIIETLGINPGRVEPQSFITDLGTYFPPVYEPDWTNRIEFTTSWQTAISQSPLTGTEERHSLKTRPTREISFSTSSMSQAGSMQLQMSTFQLMNARTPMPIYCDLTTLVRAVGTSATEIECYTLHKRFFSGQRALVVKRDFSRFDISGVNSYGFYIDIKEVALDRLIVEQGAVLVPLDGTELLFPCMDVHPLLKQDGTLYSDFYTSARVTALEIDGNSTLPPSWQGEIGAYHDYYEGYPIFKIEPNYATSVKQSYFRPGKEFRSGRSTQVASYSDLPSIALEYSEFNTSRREAWDLLRFFDSRRGAAEAFWAIQPLTSWKYITTTDTSVQAEGFDYLDVTKKYIKHIGIETTEGDLYVKAIDDITEASSRFTIDFSSDRFTVVPNIRRVSPAWLCRFDDDSLTQKWDTDRIETSTVKIMGLRNEQEALIGEAV